MYCFCMPSAQIPLSTREKIVTAAQSLYASQGVSATSPQDVLDAAGVGHGSLYHHFRRKGDLALAAIGRTASETLERARIELTGESPAAERIASYLSRPRDATAGCRVGSLTADPTVMSDDTLAEPVRQYFIDLVDLVTAGYREAGAGEQSSDLAYAAVAVLQGGYVMSRALGTNAPMDAAVRGFLSASEAVLNERTASR
jgi:AcrR family transcriptional regulator